MAYPNFLYSSKLYSETPVRTGAFLVAYYSSSDKANDVKSLFVCPPDGDSWTYCGKNDIYTELESTSVSLDYSNADLGVAKFYDCTSDLTSLTVTNAVSGEEPQTTMFVKFKTGEGFQLNLEGFTYLDEEVGTIPDLAEGYTYLLTIRNGFVTIDSSLRLDLTSATNEDIDGIFEDSETSEDIKLLINVSNLRHFWNIAKESSKQSDWEQNEESEADYIKNRTHWKEETIIQEAKHIDETNYDDQQEIARSLMNVYENIQLTAKLIIGTTITFNGVDFQLTEENRVNDPEFVSGETQWFFGKYSLFGDNVDVFVAQICQDSQSDELLIEWFSDDVSLGGNTMPGKTILIPIYEDDEREYSFDLPALESVEYHKLNKGYVDTDWDENNNESVSHIKNRTHWREHIIEDARTLNLENYDEWDEEYSYALYNNVKLAESALIDSTITIHDIDEGEPIEETITLTNENRSLSLNFESGVWYFGTLYDAAINSGEASPEEIEQMGYTSLFKSSHVYADAGQNMWSDNVIGYAMLNARVTNIPSAYTFLQYYQDSDNYDERTLNAINEYIYHKIDPNYLPENIQSDWEQNNSTQIDYIKNRTHYEYDELVYPEESEGTINEYYRIDDSLDTLKNRKFRSFTGDIIIDWIYNADNEQWMPRSVSGEGILKGNMEYVDNNTYEIARIRISRLTYSNNILNVKEQSTIDGNVFEPGLYILDSDEIFGIYFTRVKKIDPKFLPDSLSTPDWEQNEESESDYIKNRTHWKEHVVIEARELNDENYDEYDDNNDVFVYYNVELTENILLGSVLTHYEGSEEESIILTQENKVTSISGILSGESGKVWYFDSYANYIQGLLGIDFEVIAAMLNVSPDILASTFIYADVYNNQWCSNYHIMDALVPIGDYDNKSFLIRNNTYDEEYCTLQLNATDEYVYHKLYKGYIPIDVQGDWDENDETKLSHIKNRTHYVEYSDLYPEEGDEPINDYFRIGDPVDSLTDCDLYFKTGSTISRKMKGSYNKELNGWTINELDDSIFLYYYNGNEYEFAKLGSSENATVLNVKVQTEIWGNIFEPGIYTFNGGDTYGVLVPKVKKLDSKFLSLDSQGDWDENDETKISHIKNRTHWVENKRIDTSYDYNKTLTIYSNSEAPIGNPPIPSDYIKNGESYTVRFKSATKDVYYRNIKALSDYNIKIPEIGFSTYSFGQYLYYSTTSEFETDEYTITFYKESISGDFYTLNDKFLSGNIVRKNELSAVSTTGDYNDLINRYRQKADTTDLVQNMKSNIFYVWTSPLTENDLFSPTFDTEELDTSIVNEYAGIFTTGNTVPDVVMPAGIIWLGGLPNFLPNHIYEFSVIDNYGVFSPQDFVTTDTVQTMIETAISQAKTQWEDLI